MEKARDGTPPRETRCRHAPRSGHPGSAASPVAGVACSRCCAGSPWAEPMSSRSNH